MTEIKTSEFSNNLIDHCLNVFFARNITFDCDNYAAFCLCNFLRCLFGLCYIEVNYCYVRSCLCKCRSCTLADSPRCTCNETFLSVKTHLFNDTHESFYLPLYIKICRR